MGDTKSTELVRASIDAFNAADWNRFKESHAPNVVYDEVATGRRLTGPQEVVDSAKAWKKAFPDAHGTVKEVFASGNHTLVEIEWKGKHTGELKTPLGTIPPTGKAMTMRALMHATVDGNRILSNQQYFDMLSMLRQIGALNETLARSANA